MTQEPQDLSAVGWPVHTARLSIRPMTAEDIEPTWQIRRLPEGVRVARPRLLADLDAVRRADVASRSGARRTLMVEHERPDRRRPLPRHHRRLGAVRRRRGAKGVQAEIGWAIDPAYGGRGLATEAAAELVRICFEDLGLRRLKALCFADNVPSWRLMERLGMRREEYAVQDSLHRTRAGSTG